MDFVSFLLSFFAWRQVRLSSLCFLLVSNGTPRIRYVFPSCWVNSWSHAQHVDICAKHKKVRVCQEDHRVRQPLRHHKGQPKTT